MENFINLIKEKGQLFVSRKSVDTPYRMGLRFKGLNDQDRYILAQTSDKLGYKFQSRQKRARVISNKLIVKLFEMSDEMENTIVEQLIENPMVCKVFNDYTDNKTLSFQSVEVDEDLPF